MVSSLALRSLPMTSGLFNTGVTGDSLEITSLDTTVKSANPTAMKVTGHEDFSAESLYPEFDMNMFGDLDAGLADPLGDASMDSFIDLSAFLSENTFLESAVEEKGDPLDFLDFDIDVSGSKKPVKRSFEEMEAESDLNEQSVNVSLPSISTHDHDYTTKRPRMSTVTEEPSVAKVEEVYMPPPPSPNPSTSYIITENMEDKMHHRRVKNNIASKRSRQVRKQKFVSMESEAEQLIMDNARLEKRIVELEQLAKQMKEILVAKMAGK